MKKITMILLLSLSIPAIAAEDIHGASISYVYQLDIAPTEFDFQANKTNSCGSNIYRVKSNNEAVANRKFSIVLGAFMAEKNLSFHHTGACESNRGVVGWVRVTN